MKTALYIRHIDDSARPYLAALVETLHSHGVETRQVADGDSVDGCDLLLSIGGDGTLLSSVQFVHSSTPAAFPPILGINFGHLGFLTAAGKEDAATLVDDLLQGRYTLEERTLLEVQDGASYALNEVFLHRSESASLLRTEVRVDGDYVATYAGDGVIVATPTGSTAYSLSCGGPILTPDSRCLAITPVSAHTLTLRPIIVPDSATVELRVEAADRYTLGVDSRRTACQGPSRLTLRRAPFTIRLVRTGSQSFFSAIRDKLSWGN
ncbi:MAG: NAD(+)/NADH kinase [Bacteroidales bacterium]|nr:NAD(+)/NADH kinase [Bacteroidales bacterium]